MKKLSEIPGFISYLIWRWRTMETIDKLWIAKNYTELISICDIMISKNPEDYMGFYYRGLSNEALAFYDNAINDLRQSEITIINFRRKSLVKEYFSKIPIQLSRVYRKMQDNEKAFEYAGKAIQVDREDVDGLKWRSSLKEDLGDYTGAIEDLNEALKRKPKEKIITRMRDRLIYILIEEKKHVARN